MEDTLGDGTPLDGGDTSGSVIRIGDTVRKPWLPTSEHTIAYVAALRRRGLDVPEARGRDAQGRLVLEYVPGELAMRRAPLSPDVLHRVGALVRRIHDASAGMPCPGDWKVLIPVDGPDLLCHNDLAPWNLVIDGDRLVFIDWDGSGPSTRLWDLAYAGVAFGHLFPDAAPHGAATRLRAFVEGYAADVSLLAALPEAMAARARAMHDLLRDSYRTGREPWGSMYLERHGDHWAGTARFVERHRAIWQRALS